jgi:hypothetical protein
VADNELTKPKPRRNSKTSRDPFEVKLSEEKTEELVAFLVRELQYAEQARDQVVGDNGRIDQAHLMYEGGDKLTKNTPWPGAANLGSWIVTEKIGSMRARIVATLFADPIWIVEGFGAAAERAPLIEAVHQWKADQEKLQTFLARVVHNSLIEGTGVLEVSDNVVMRKGLKRMKALVQRDHMTGAVVLGEDGQPIVVRDAAGKLVEAEPEEPNLELITNDVVRATAGPSYRVLSLKNFFLLPGHASEREDIWGYAKKFYRRLPVLQQREREGFYKNVEKLGRSGERDSPSGSSTEFPADQRAGGYTTPTQFDETAEKEIWEVTFLADLDNDGYEEWYVATVSLLHRTLLRLQYQDYGTPHYVLFTPFPRANSVYGYSYAIDILGSLYDEHSALRNMFADRSVLATSAPFLQLEGSAWNPGRRPFGPRQVIPVRDMNELKQLEVRDVPQSVITAMQMVLSAAERVSGQNDVTTGHLAQQDRTLGEVKLTTEQSFVRIDEIVHNFQEGMEDLFDLHHIILKNKLQKEPEPIPGDIQQTMLERAIEIPNGLLTADLLEGVFRGKPHGSVESADFSKMRVDFAGLITAMTQLAQTVPAVAMHLNQPPVVRSIISQLARIYQWPDRQNLVATFTGMMPMQPPMSGAPGMLPGAPMQGAPPNVTPPQRRPFANAGAR